MGIKYDNNVGPMIVDDTTGKLVGYVDGQGINRYLDGRPMPSTEDGSGDAVGGGVILAGQMLIVGRTGTTVSLNSANVAGDTTYKQIASFVVPGGLMGPHGMMRPRLNLRGTSSASTKAFRVLVNGVQIGAELTLTTASTYQDFAPMLCNKGEESSNEHVASLLMFGGGSTIAPTTTTINTSVEMTVVVQARWTAPVAGEFVSMLSGHIEIYPGM